MCARTLRASIFQDKFLSNGVGDHLFRIFEVDAGGGGGGALGNVKVERKDAFDLVE